MSIIFLFMAAHTLGSIRADCVGYIVSGAGTPGVDGCYVYHPEGALYVKDSGHELYTWDSVWRIGEKGKNISYIALKPSKFPPAAPGGCNLRWTTAEYGEPPCPKLQRNGLPPLPPAPAPSPAPRPPLPPPPPPMRLVWEDDFDQDQLNRSRWNILEQV